MTNEPSAYIRTRAHDRDYDYAFLGAEPSIDWLAGLLPFMETTRPCMALEQTADGWRLFVDGIPSVKRFDFSPRRIRYTVILEQGQGQTDHAKMRDGAATLITLLLSGIENPDRFAAISRAFDEQFSDDAWVVRQRVTRDAVSAREAEQKVFAALAAITLPPDSPAVVARRSAESWLWDARDPQARADFLSAAIALLARSGQRGDLALVLNLVSHADAAPQPTAPASTVILANLAGQGRVRQQPIQVRPGKEIASWPAQRTGWLATVPRHLTAPPVRLARTSGTWLNAQARRSAAWIRNRWRRAGRRNSPSA